MGEGLWDREKMWQQAAADLFGLFSQALGEQSRYFFEQAGLKIGWEAEKKYKSIYGIRGNLHPEEIKQLARYYPWDLPENSWKVEWMGEELCLSRDRCPFNVSIFQSSAVCCFDAAFFGGIVSRNRGPVKAVFRSTLLQGGGRCEIVFLPQLADTLDAEVYRGYEDVVVQPFCCPLVREKVPPGSRSAFSRLRSDFLRVDSLYNVLVEEVYLSLNVGVVIVDPRGEVVRSNTMVEQMTGDEVERAELIDIVRSYLQKTLDTKRPFRQREIKLAGADNSVRYFSLSTFFLKDQFQEVRGAIGFFQETTYCRRMEDNMANMEKYAVLVELAAGMAHEVRNPLAAVKGFLQLLQDEVGNKTRGKNYCRVMLEEVERANSIIEEFLMLTKPSASCWDEVEIHSLLDDVLLLVESRFHLRSIAVRKDYARGVASAKGDSAQIKQVLLNLVNNAVQAMPEGGCLTVRTEYRSEMVCIEISDTGVGIPLENMNRIYDPFFTTKENGTGLGLTISRRIVQNHGGRLTVKSGSSGTTVIVSLLPAGD